MDTERDSRSSLQSAPCLKLAAFLSKMHLRHPAVSKNVFVCKQALSIAERGFGSHLAILGFTDLCYPLAVSLSSLVLQS